MDLALQSMDCEVVNSESWPESDCDAAAQPQISSSHCKNSDLQQFVYKKKILRSERWNSTQSFCKIVLRGNLNLVLSHILASILLVMSRRTGKKRRPSLECVSEALGKEHMLRWVLPGWSVQRLTVSWQGQAAGHHVCACISGQGQVFPECRGGSAAGHHCLTTA